MNWENKLHLWQSLMQPSHRLENVHHWSTLIFPSMCCNQNLFSRAVQQLLQCRISKFIMCMYSRQQRVNYSISCHKDFLIISTFPQQIVSRLWCRRKVKCRHHAGQLSISFLRIRRIQIARTQACLHVSDGNLLIKCRQSCSKCCCRIAMHQHQVRLFLLQNLLQPVQYTSSNICQSLIFFHQIQIIVRRNPKQLQHLIQHLSMLCCHRHDTLQMLILFNGFHHRRHLDSFRSCSKHTHYFFHNSVILLFIFIQR